MKTIHESLKEARTNSCYSQEYVAKKIGSHSGTISGYERGKFMPSVFVLIELADLYGVSLDELVGREFNKNSGLSMTNKEFLQSATDEQISSFIKSTSFNGKAPWNEICRSCKPVEVYGAKISMNLRECDFIDGVCPNKDPIIWWLNQEYNEEDSVWKE